MAKEKRPVADLDAELAALEAELAALEGRKPAPRKPAVRAPQRAPEAAPEAAREPAPAEPKKARFAFGKKKEAAVEAAPAAEPAPVAEEPRRRGLPSFGRRKAEAPADQPPAAPAPAPEPAPAPPPRAAPAPRQGSSILITDPTPWRQEGSAWVRAVPDSPTSVVRRILDEEDRVVREETADASALAEAAGAEERTDKGFGRLFRRRG